VLVCNAGCKRVSEQLGVAYPADNVNARQSSSQENQYFRPITIQ
jgi:hypothetical protein